MLIASILVHSDNIICNDSAASKKRIIENLSNLLALNTTAAPAEQIFQALLERERLGSTGLGKGVAIPHARLPGLTQTVAAMLTLDTPVNFESSDKQPVDIAFGLLVPEDDDDHHLEYLAQLVTIFRDDDICQKIRNTNDPDQIFEILLAIDED